MATSEDITTAIRWHHEIFLARQFESAHKILTEDFEWHSPLLPEPVKGREGAASVARMLCDAYPDLDLPHVGTVAEAGTVVTRWQLTGTAAKPVGALPGNGRRVSVTGIDWFELADGKIRRLYQEVDVARWVSQLGS
jgi:steroid delta-isomerase-like uncharacterized protein